MADKLIVKGSSEKSVNTLIEYFDVASTFLTHQQMASLVKHDGGGKNLLGVITHKDTLRQRGFPDQDIVKMAANDGGSKTIEYIIKNQSIIIASNLSCSDIVTKCNANSGHARLKAFLNRKASVDA